MPETLVHGFEGWLPKLVQIGRMRTREFVLTYGPGEAFERAAEVVRDWSRARLISMVLHKPGGGRVEMELLRDDGWLPSLPRVGGKYWLSMPEMGVEGACDLMGVEPCPPVPAGPGRMVTGTFRHTSGEVYDLQVAAESQPLGVTATHPFWSVDRHMWVSAIDLRIGETLKILTGTTQVVSMKKRPGTETVCNIEVEGDHVYRVGKSGVLVHNVSHCDELSCATDEQICRFLSESAAAIYAALLGATGIPVWVRTVAVGYSSGVCKFAVSCNVSESDDSCDRGITAASAVAATRGISYAGLIPVDGEPFFWHAEAQLLQVMTPEFIAITRRPCEPSSSPRSPARSCADRLRTAGSRVC